MPQDNADSHRLRIDIIGIDTMQYKHLFLYSVRQH